MKRFIHRSYQTGKKHALTASIAFVVSSVLPILQEWHSERQVEKAIEAVETRMQKEMDELRAQNKAQWQAIDKCVRLDQLEILEIKHKTP